MAKARGRPPIPDNRKRSCALMVRITEEQADELDARRGKIGRAEYVRRLLFSIPQSDDGCTSPLRPGPSISSSASHEELVTIDVPAGGEPVWLPADMIVELDHFRGPYSRHEFLHRALMRFTDRMSGPCSGSG